MLLSGTPGAYDGSQEIRALSREEALRTLREAAAAGLVHSVANSQAGAWYICNCCTCGCDILRGMADAGAPAVVAGSSCASRVDAEAVASAGGHSVYRITGVNPNGHSRPRCCCLYPGAAM